MKFNRLQASIANNADQSPSLYMALCLVESLFSDMEDACGVDLSRCPVGDERLSTKLTWLCRVVNEIYGDNSDELQRNRARLDAAVKKLQATQMELEDLNSIESRLKELKNEQALLEDKLEARKDSAKACERLAAQCAQAREQLAALKQFDVDAAEAELEALNREAAQLSQNNKNLQGELQKTRELTKSLGQQVMEKEAEKAKLQGQVNDMNLEMSDILKTIGELEEEKQKLIHIRADVDAVRQKHTAECEEAQQEAALLRAQVRVLQEEELPEIRALLTAIQQDKLNLEQSKLGASQEYEQLKNERNQLILDVAHQKEDNESLTRKLDTARENLAALKNTRSSLDTDLTGCLQNLEQLQEEVEQLQTKKIPEAQQLRQQEQQRRDELQQTITQLETQRAAYKEEIEKMEERLPKLEKEVEDDRVVYDALTASCTTKSNELERLERQITELRSNNDEEKLEIYRKQMEEMQRQLEKVQAECLRIEQESIQMQQKLEEGQQERTRLQEMKRRRESGIEATERQLRELEFAGTERYAREVAAVEERAKLLESVRGKLAASMANMRSILGQKPTEEQASLEEQLKHGLRDLRQCTEDLRNALLNCAKSLKLEER